MWYLQEATKKLKVYLTKFYSLINWSGELHFVNTPEFRLFDMRTGHQLQVYQQTGGSDVPTVTSTAFSSSDSLLFADIPMGIASYGILY
ncbi:hypothetical protein MKW92_028304 [Papaver armeniacum]|nr:hypothetical protein MKW92_028304 [Papaver armeniacum]